MNTAKSLVDPGCAKTLVPAQCDDPAGLDCFIETFLGLAVFVADWSIWQGFPAQSVEMLTGLYSKIEEYAAVKQVSGQVDVSLEN